jgi:hypothetical protein
MSVTVVQPQQDVSGDPQWIGDVFRSLAADAARRFQGRTARVHDSPIVHAVRLESWIGDVLVPAPLCHVEIGGFAMSALTPSTAPVTCAPCLHKLDTDADRARGQQRLW